MSAAEPGTGLEGQIVAQNGDEEFLNGEQEEGEDGEHTGSRNGAGRSQDPQGVNLTPPAIRLLTHTGTNMALDPRFEDINDEFVPQAGPYAGMRLQHSYRRPKGLNGNEQATALVTARLAYVRFMEQEAQKGAEALVPGAAARPAEHSPADQLELAKKVSRPTYKVQPPQSFSGDGAKAQIADKQAAMQAAMKVAEELEAFLSAMPEYLRLTHTPAADWALVAATYLKGSAQGYYRALVNARGAEFQPDWSFFCDSLRAHFVSPAQAAYVLITYMAALWAKGCVTWIALKAAEEVAWQKLSLALGPTSQYFTDGTGRVWTLVRAGVMLAALPPKAQELVLTNDDLRPHSTLSSLLRMMEKKATQVNEFLAAAASGNKRQRSDSEAGPSTPPQNKGNCRACHQPGHFVDECTNAALKAAYLAANPNHGKVRGPPGPPSSAGRGSGAPAGRFGQRDSAGRGFGRGRGSQQHNMQQSGSMQNAAVVPVPAPANQ